jgi:DNA mismatch endonuclease (patch repair protein)
MRLQRTRDTKPEMALRRALHHRGWRYRVNTRPLRDLNRRADLVFTRRKVAVFVDGCFWHGCPEHGRRNHKINAWYWPDKIQGNVDRDADTGRRLQAAGWQVVRIWEHESLEGAVETVEVALRSAERGSRHVRPL